MLLFLILQRIGCQIITEFNAVGWTELLGVRVPPNYVNIR